MEISETNSPRLSIKKWSVSDRPREKMALQGRNVLTDGELLAILLGSGNSRQSAVELARDILMSVNHDLNELGKLSISDLKKFKGVGEAKAVVLTAALELGRRRKKAGTTLKPRVTSSRDVYEHMKPHLLDIPHEEFWIVMLNRGNYIMDTCKVSQGGVTGTVADTRIIYQRALEKRACAIILCHNHPSGNIKPSEADIALTAKLKEAGKVMDIPVLDHIIFTDQEYYSFADEGLI